MKLNLIPNRIPTWILLLFIEAIAASSIVHTAASAAGDKAFYDTIRSGTTLEKVEGITSQSLPDVHGEDIQEILELFQDGKIYPVLKKEEKTYTPPSQDFEHDNKNEDKNIKNHKINNKDDNIDDNDDTIDDKVDTPDINVSKIEHVPITTIGSADKITESLDSVASNNLDDLTTLKSMSKFVRAIQRIKRTTDPNQTVKIPSNKRMKTGDTILNIHGAVKDSIGDASVGSNGVDSSHIDTVVIHPSQFLKEEFTLQPRESSTHPTLVYENEVIVEAGSRVIIDCKLPSNVTFTKWTKDGLRASPSNRKLEISRAVRGDAGIWRCVGRDSMGTEFYGDEKILRVYEEAGLPYLKLDGRRLDAGNTWMPAREGNTLEVLCIVEGGVPAPVLTWRVIGSNPAEDEHLSRYLNILPDNHTYGGITISKVRLSVHRLHHNSSLQCAREQRSPEPNVNIKQFAQLKLDVTYPPSFVISRWPGFGVSLRVGSTAALRCDVDANPPARPYWHSDTNPTPYPTLSPANHATVRWQSLLPEHSGWYRCIAAWSGTQYSSIGYYLNIKPSDELTTGLSSSEDPSTSSHMTVQFGSNLQLNCPKGSVGCWSRRVLSDNNSLESWVPVGSQNAHGVLGIRGALYQEAGEYRCVGASIADQTRLKELKKVTLHLTGPPSITPLPSSERQFSAEVCGTSGAGNARWLAGGSVLRPGFSAAVARASPPRTSGMGCYRLTLTLHDTNTDEVWLVISSPSSGGAVYAWPPIAPPPPRALASQGNIKLCDSFFNPLLTVTVFFVRRF